MDGLIVELAKQWGGLGLALATILYIVFDKSEFIKRWFDNSANATKARNDEREQLSEDLQNFVKTIISDRDNLRKEVDNLWKLRNEDRVHCDKKLDDMTKRLDELMEDNRKWRVDSAKWRHLSGNLGMFANRLRKCLGDAGIEAPRFDAWEKFLAEGGNAAEFDFDP